MTKILVNIYMEVSLKERRSRAPLITWLNRKINSTIYAVVISLILGNLHNEILVNTTFLITKHGIFKSMRKNQILTLNYLKKILKDHMDTDIYLGTIKNKIDKALRKWVQLHNELIRVWNRINLTRV